MPSYPVHVIRPDGSIDALPIGNARLPHDAHLHCRWKLVRWPDFPQGVFARPSEIAEGLRAIDLELKAVMQPGGFARLTLLVEEAQAGLLWGAHEFQPLRPIDWREVLRRDARENPRGESEARLRALQAESPRTRRKSWDDWLRSTAQVLEAHERAKLEKQRDPGSPPGERGRQVEGPR